MFIRFFTSGMPFPQYAGVFLTAALLWAGVLIHFPDNPMFQISCQWDLVGGSMQGLAKRYPLIVAAVAVVCIVIQALWITNIARFMGFISKTSLMPAFIYILVVGVPVEGVLALQVIIANFFVIAVIRSIVRACFYDNPLPKIFHGALMVTLGGVVYLPVLGLWPFLILAFINIRAFSLRVLLFALLAFLPVAGALMIYLIYMDVSAFQSFALPLFCISSWSLVFQVPPVQRYTAYFLLLFVGLLIWFKMRWFSDQVVSFRRLSAVILWYIFFVILLSGFADNFLVHATMLAPGLAVLAGEAAGGTRRTLAGNIILWVFILGIVFLRVEHLITPVIPGT